MSLWLAHAPNTKRLHKHFTKRLTPNGDYLRTYYSDKAGNFYSYTRPTAEKKAGQWAIENAPTKRDKKETKEAAASDE